MKKRCNSKYGGIHESFQKKYSRTKVWFRDFDLLIIDVNGKSNRDVIILLALNFPLPLICMWQQKIVYWFSSVDGFLKLNTDGAS